MSPYIADDVTAIKMSIALDELVDLDNQASRFEAYQTAGLSKNDYERLDAKALRYEKAHRKLFCNNHRVASLSALEA